MCSFHHDRWLCSLYSDTVVDTVKSTDICGQNRCSKLICLGLLKTVYRCYVPLRFLHNSVVSGGFLGT